MHYLKKLSLQQSKQFKQSNSSDSQLFKNGPVFTQHQCKILITFSSVHVLFSIHYICKTVFVGYLHIVSLFILTLIMSRIEFISRGGKSGSEEKST